MFAFSPLAGPECRWAISRKWVFIMRTVAAVLCFGILIFAAWCCWLMQVVDEGTVPSLILSVSVTALVLLNLSLVLLISPAVLAGGFSDDPERMALGMLLSTRLSAGEIVYSRFISRLVQVATVSLAGLPAIVFLGIFCGMTTESLLVLLVLMFATASGVAGLALLFFVLFTRARDALIATYVVGLLLLILPILIGGRLNLSWASWLIALNPYTCVTGLIYSGDIIPASRTIAVWSVMAIISLTLTLRLLWPTYLRRAGGDFRSSNRQREIPPMGSNPIQWKELYIESTREFGRLLSAVIFLTLVMMLGGSILLMSLFLWTMINPQPPLFVQNTLAIASQWIGILAVPLGWLIQWAVGIRAAAGISMEKEQGTWDALMMTPLEGGEIVKAKMIVSFYSLRWFLIATLLVWLLGVMMESITFYAFFMMVLSSAMYICVMSAIGVWSSLTTKSSGRAITLTLLGWMGVKIAVSIVAVLLVLASMLLLLIASSMLQQIGGGGSAVNFRQPVSFETGYHFYEAVLCIAATLGIAWHCRQRFDRLAGRGHRRSKPVLVRVPS